MIKSASEIHKLFKKHLPNKPQHLTLLINTSDSTLYYKKSKQDYYSWTMYKSTENVRYTYKRLISLHFLLRQEVYTQMMKTTCQRYLQCLLTANHKDARLTNSIKGKIGQILVKQCLWLWCCASEQELWNQMVWHLGVWPNFFHKFHKFCDPVPLSVNGIRAPSHWECYALIWRYLQC